ncbi:MAG: regulatory protein RecX [Hungatella sp.]
MLITSIAPLDQRRSKIFLEENFILVLYQGELRRYHLEVGSELTPEDYREILETILCKRARERALYLMKYSDKTEREIRRKLKDGFYPEEAIDRAVAFLKEYRYIDDESYATRYIECYGSKKSRRQMHYDLQQKGLPRELVESLLQASPVDEETQIIRFLQKKDYDMEHTNQKDRSKLVASLARKGFAFDTIRKVMQEAFS